MLARSFHVNPTRPPLDPKVQVVDPPLRFAVYCISADAPLKKSTIEYGAWSLKQSA